MAQATRVVVSYPSDLNERGRENVEEERFQRYLQRAHDTAREGDVWEELVSTGCCGSSATVDFHVEGVEGGTEVTEGTAFEFAIRDGATVKSDWAILNGDEPHAN